MKYFVELHPLVIEAHDEEHAKNVATFAKATPRYDLVRKAVDDDEIDGLLVNRKIDPDAYESARQCAKGRAFLEGKIEGEL